MGNLFIIDQSLKEMGGHHFDYTCLVARAAIDAGMDPVVATNAMLNPKCRTRLAEFGEVRSVFRDTTYTCYSRLSGLKELTKSASEPKSILPQRPQADRNAVYNFFGRLSRKRRFKKRERVIRRFAEDCENLFSKYSVGAEDHVLFTTVSELEFMGLAAWLGAHPDTLQAVWHAQFHFSIYSGNPNDSQAQSNELRAIGDCFQHALARVPYHDIRVYTTSKQLTQQYNEMRLLQFQDLPYPIRPELVSPDSMIHNLQKEEDETNYGPLRVTIAGGVRREKGQKDRLTQVISDVWESHVLTGKVQFNVQTNQPKNFNSQQVLGTQRARIVDSKMFNRMVTPLRHPLPEEEYLNLIVNSDIGLFCYDNKRYYSRRAGILCEFLAAGKPVIVPAGCWLSEQIAAQSAGHIRELVRSADEVADLQLSELKWGDRNVPAAGGIVTFDHDRNPFECSFRRNNIDLANTTGLAIQFDWHWPSQPGCFVNVQATTLDDAGRHILVENQTSSIDNSGHPSIVYFQLPDDFDTINFSFRNAFQHSSISIKSLHLQVLNFADQPAPPRSSVGVISADHESTVAAVDEIVNHYDHYLSSAQKFARTWAWQHHPNRTMECLLGTPNAQVKLRRSA